jgi:hypothetical protein
MIYYELVPSSLTRGELKIVPMDWFERAFIISVINPALESLAYCQAPGGISRLASLSEAHPIQHG